MQSAFDMEFTLITADSVTAAIMDMAGVNRIMIDLERNGKAERQKGYDTFISDHTMDDVSSMRKLLKSAKLQVRLNPVHVGTQYEVDEAIQRGADMLMLPMFTHADEVRQFCDIVDGRVPVVLLAETPAAMARIEDIIAVPGVSEVHIGLNDLQLGLGLDFVFETLAYGLVDRMAGYLRQSGMVFGFGGVAGLDQGALAGRRVIAEHARLGSTRAILPRVFIQSVQNAGHDFETRLMFAKAQIDSLRMHYQLALLRSIDQAQSDFLKTSNEIRYIAARIREERATMFKKAI